MRNAWCTHTSFRSRPPGARLLSATRAWNLFVIHSHSFKLIIHASVRVYTHARPFTRDTRVAVVRHVTQSLWLLEIQFAFSMVATHARDTSLNFFCLAFSFLFSICLFCVRACMCFFFFYSFNCRCNGLVDFFDNSAISLRFHSRNRCDRVISNERGKGDIKDTFIDREGLMSW